MNFIAPLKIRKPSSEGKGENSPPIHSELSFQRKTKDYSKLLRCQSMKNPYIRFQPICAEKKRAAKRMT